MKPKKGTAGMAARCYDASGQEQRNPGGESGHHQQQPQQHLSENAKGRRGKKTIIVPLKGILKNSPQMPRSTNNLTPAADDGISSSSRHAYREPRKPSATLSDAENGLDGTYHIVLDTDDEDDAPPPDTTDSSRRGNKGPHHGGEHHHHKADNRSDSVVCVGSYSKSDFDLEQTSRIRNNVVLRPEDKVDITHFNILKVLGTGAYGKVYLVRKNGGVDHNKLYAMKVLKKSNLIQKKKTAEHTRTERQVLEAIKDSPFLIDFHYGFQTESRLYLVIDYVSGGELFTHLYTRENFTENEVRIYIAEIVVALEQLHKLGIIYRDIKLENILLDADGHIVITDFGLSKELTAEKNGRAYSFCGTIEYMAPEVVKQQGNQGHDFAADWWSVGVLAYELLTGSSPFTHEGEKNTQHDISLRIQKGPPPLPERLSYDVRDLISKLLIKDPKKRLGGSKVDATDIKSHPFFRRIDWEKLVRKEIPAPFRPPKDYETDTANFSEEFTRLPTADSPCPVPPNHERLFRGYSFVSPHLLRLRDAFEEHGVVHTQARLKPSLRDLESLRESELPFFQKYEIDFGECLGDGAFSVCMKCTRRNTREVFAVKILNATHDAQSEIDTLIACQGHPQIVRFIEVIRDQAFIYIVLEYLDGGELFRRIQQAKKFTEIEASGIFTQIVKAVQFMHSKNIAHRDLKPENVIFAGKKSNLVKVVDFGFAVRQDPAHTSAPPSAYTLEYAAPEVLAKGAAIGDKVHMEACDLWSLGVILYTMLCGQSPFRTASDDVEGGLVEKIRMGAFDTKTPAWKMISSSAKDLVTRLLNVDTETRMEMNELVNHPWLQGTTMRKSQLTHLPLTQDLAKLDLTVKHIFNAYKHAQTKGFTVSEVENAKLPRRRHKNHQSGTSMGSSESDLGRSKSSSGVVTSDLNNRSLSVDTSSDVEIVAEFSLEYPPEGVTLNNNEATKEAAAAAATRDETEEKCDEEIPVENPSTEAPEDATRRSREESRDTIPYRDLSPAEENHADDEEVAEEEATEMKDQQAVQESSPQQQRQPSETFKVHEMPNMFAGIPPGGHIKCPIERFVGFSVQEQRAMYGKSMENEEVHKNILCTLRIQMRKRKNPQKNAENSSKRMKRNAEMAANGHRMTTRHFRKEEICGREDLFKDDEAFYYNAIPALMKKEWKER
uniref:non-specific serine/threonine protein kinase n=1 Tax=Lutzomyia longipalpis TaxID=7200 RepID=A0A7G3AY86_LUTLO